MTSSVRYEKKIENTAVSDLINNGLIDLQHVKLLHPRTRDRDDIDVLQCGNTGVIFLQSSAHIDEAYYEDKRDEDAVALATRSELVKDNDTLRRVASHQGMIQNRSWLDVGCGECRMLRSMGSRAKRAFGYEPTAWRAESDDREGYRIIRDLKELRGEQMDVISLFHVLEHLTEPVSILRGLSEALVTGGSMIVEVPHARDALLDLYECNAYRDHTFWSEHLVLHTAESLAATMELAGLEVENLSGCQRYPLANHLYWLSQGKAGGQEVWHDLRDEDLDAAYEANLVATRRTDTLVAIAKKPDV